MDSRPGAVRHTGASGGTLGARPTPTPPQCTAESMLQELRFWHLVTACMWHAASCLAVVTVLHTFVGVPGGYLWALCLATFFSALQVPLLYTQRKVLVPAPRDRHSPGSYALPPALKTASAYPDQAAAQVAQDALDTVALLCAACGVGAVSVSTVLSAMGSSVAPSIAATSGVALGLCHTLWMRFRHGYIAPFPPLPRPRLFRVRQALPTAAHEAAQLTTVSLLGLLPYLLFTSRPQLWQLGVGGTASLAMAVASVAASMQFCRHLLAVVHTERFRFWPLTHSVDLTAETLPLRRALQVPVADAFARHLAYEDLCFVAEKDAARRSSVFEDQSGTSWTELVKAAVAPLDEIVAAIKAAEQARQPSAAAGTLRENVQLAVWSMRALAAMGAASRFQDRFGVAQRCGPTLGDVLSRLLSLHLALRAYKASQVPATAVDLSTRLASLTHDAVSKRQPPESVLSDAAQTALVTLVDAFGDAAAVLHTAKDSPSYGAPANFKAVLTALGRSNG